VSFVDIYPTLIDVCGLSPKKELEGKSLLPLLKNPKASWQRPALTTYGRNNHSLRGERWRYIRYSDGTEELYDHDKDELEWDNLANEPEYADIKKELARWLPKTNAPDVPRVNRKKLQAEKSECNT
jgi:arylsulfatase A-like enzyme